MGLLRPPTTEQVSRAHMGAAMNISLRLAKSALVYHEHLVVDAHKSVRDE